MAWWCFWRRVRNSRPTLCADTDRFGRTLECAKDRLREFRRLEAWGLPGPPPINFNGPPPEDRKRPIPPPPPPPKRCNCSECPRCRRIRGYQPVGDTLDVASLKPPHGDMAIETGAAT